MLSAVRFSSRTEANSTASEGSKHDEVEAHDIELVEETYREFRAKLKAYQAVLTAEFGEPSESGQDEHDAIPRNGIFEHLVWNVDGKSLFLAMAHEDTELPCELLLGVTRE